MADTFRVRGGKSLEGEISVRGSKNAALAVIAATVLTDERCVLHNVPRIRDVENLLEILRGLGGEYAWKDNRLEISNAHLNSFEPNPEIVRRLRGSVLVAGSLFARFGKVLMNLPGGDQIGARALDAHLAVFRGLGAEVTEKGDHSWSISIGGSPHSAAARKIVLPEPSVTATEIALMASTRLHGETVIKIAATEPHVQALAHFLNAMGAHIEGAGTNTIVVKNQSRRGALELRDPGYTIIPDSDEALSLAVLAACTRGDILIKNIVPDFMEAGLQKLQQVGVNFEVSPPADRNGDHGGWLHIKKPLSSYRALKIKVGPYPQLMSDQLPPFAVLATQASGMSLIHEWMYEGRLGYINELIKMGANAVVLDPHRAMVIGPTPLRGTELQSLDIRSGMTIIIAGLVADGETIIRNADVIDRGYERIEERLKVLGADIERIASVE